jgi:SAM-dependent methyltransferase
MLGQGIKSFLKAIPIVRLAMYIAQDLKQGLHLALGQIVTESGSTHLMRSESESLSYIEEVFTDYKTYGGIEKFSGVVAEIGPGDSAGVAMLMRYDGCDRVDLIDRYYSHRNLEQQSNLYEALAQKYQLHYLKTTTNWDEQSLPGITWKIGQAAEVYFKTCRQERGQIYDFIVSRAVLEHLYDPLTALQDMVACLKPGGRMFHKIDFRDHGMFTPMQNELFFLQIPGSIYPWMIRNSGRPNRIFVHRYRDVLESMKQQGLIDYSILTTHLVSIGGEIVPHQVFEEIDPDKRCPAIDFIELHREKFAKEFVDVASQDLCISGVFLIVTKYYSKTI